MKLVQNSQCPGPILDSLNPLFLVSMSGRWGNSVFLRAHSLHRMNALPLGFLSIWCGFSPFGAEWFLNLSFWFIAITLYCDRWLLDILWWSHCKVYKCRITILYTWVILLYVNHTLIFFKGNHHQQQQKKHKTYSYCSDQVNVKYSIKENKSELMLCYFIQCGLQTSSTWESPNPLKPTELEFLTKSPGDSYAD